MNMSTTGGSGGGGGAVPTGCYKCGRPGHWSRDCPSSSFSSTAPAADNNANLPPPNSNTETGSTRPPLPNQKQPKQPRKTRPKLTPDLLLSDDGFGFILRHFPRAFKYRGRGRELDDLRRLLGLYADWHSHLIPYYNFDQFIKKVEQVCATKRVKVCIRELRDRVANGLDPMKLHEPQVQQDPIDEQRDLSGGEMANQLQNDDLQNDDTSNFQEDMSEDIWEQATNADETSEGGDTATGAAEDAIHKVQEAPQSITMSEEQRARMEANKLKALERAAARARLLPRAL